MPDPICLLEEFKVPSRNKTETVFFQSNGFWVLTIGTAVIWTMIAIGSFIEGQKAAATVLIGLTIFWLLFRTFLEKRSPKWIEVDSVNKVMLIQPRWPYVNQFQVDIRSLDSVEASIPISLFPQAVLTLKYKNREKRNFYFDLDKKSSGFFSIPTEVMPDSVDCLLQILLKIKNLGDLG